MIAQTPLFLLLGSLSGFAAIGTVAMAYLIYRDKKKTEKREAERTDRVDLLDAGQKSIEQALARADAENALLRAEMKEQSADYEARQTGWTKRIEAQEDELVALRLDMGRCKQDCSDLRAQLEEYKRGQQ